MSVPPAALSELAELLLLPHVPQEVTRPAQLVEVHGRKGGDRGRGRRGSGPTADVTRARASAERRTRSVRSELRVVSEVGEVDVAVMVVMVVFVVTVRTPPLPTEPSLQRLEQEEL